MNKTIRAEAFAVVGAWLGTAIGATAWILRAACEVWSERTWVGAGLLGIAILGLGLLPVMAVLIRFRHVLPGTAFKSVVLFEWIGCIIASLVLVVSNTLALTGFSVSDLWRMNGLFGVLFLLVLIWGQANRSGVFGERGYRWLMPQGHH